MYTYTEYVCMHAHMKMPDMIEKTLSGDAVRLGAPCI